MTYEEGVLRRRAVGHPPIDDREEILGFMNARIKEGLNISQAAAGGLKIYRPLLNTDGQSYSLELVRELKPAALERRFRTLRRQENDQFDELTEPFRHERVGLIGIRTPRPSLSFTINKSFHRGRPRKNRKR